MRIRRCSGVSTMNSPPSDQNACAAEVDARRLLVDQEHLTAGLRQLRGGGQPGEAGPDDDDVCLHSAILCKKGRLTLV